MYFCLLRYEQNDRENRRGNPLRYCGTVRNVLLLYSNFNTQMKMKSKYPLKQIKKAKNRLKI